MVAGVEQRTAHDLLVEALRLVAGRESFLVGVGHPVARRVGRVHLVDQQQLRRRRSRPNSYLVSARISPAAAAICLAAGEQRQRGRLHLRPTASESTRPSLRPRRRTVSGSSCAPVLGLGGRRDDRAAGSGVFLLQAVGEVVAVDRPRPVGVLAPQRRGGDAGDVAAHDHLDRQRRAPRGRRARWGRARRRRGWRRCRRCCSNHHAASWLSTWPLYGTPAMMRSNADSRSVVTNRRVPVARHGERVRAHLAVAAVGERRGRRRRTGRAADVVSAPWRGARHLLEQWRAPLPEPAQADAAVGAAPCAGAGGR